MSSSPTEPSPLEETIAERAERFLTWGTRHRGWLLGVAVALVAAAGTGTIVTQRRAATRRALTDAFAKAVAISDAPLQAEVTEAEQALKTRREERAKTRQSRKEERKAAAKTARAKAAGDSNDGSANADDDDEEDAEDIEAEAAALAEQQAEDDEMERRKRGQPPFESVAAREKAALAAFTAVADDPSQSRLRLLAGLEAAQAASKCGDPNAGRARLEALFSAVPKGDDMWPIVASRLATALEAHGDTEQALALWAQFGAGEQRLLADEAGVQRARLLLAQGNVEAAREALQDVQLKFPNSPLDDEIRAALLEMPAATPNADAPAPSAAAAAVPAGTPKEASAPPP